MKWNDAIFRYVALSICTGLVLLSPFAANAAETSSQSVLERLDTLEHKVDLPGIWKTLGLKLSGFVDIAYTHNFNNPASNLNQLHIFDTNANAFMPHLAQLLLERPADAGGSLLERAGFRARLNFGLDSRVTRARTNFQTGTTNNELDFQEMYAQYIVPIGNGLDVKVGKMNTLIGYEVISSWENPNFSRSFMFGLGQAFTTTGIASAISSIRSSSLRSGSSMGGTMSTTIIGENYGMVGRADSASPIRCQLVRLVRS